jgi:hypothetical protein
VAGYWTLGGRAPPPHSNSNPPPCPAMKASILFAVPFDGAPPARIRPTVEVDTPSASTSALFDRSTGKVFGVGQCCPPPSPIGNR